jgi:hypothetical protein
MVRKIFGRGVHRTGHASMPANTTDKTTEDEDHPAQRTQILSPAKPCVEDAAYSRITGQEEDECGDQKRSWALRIDNSSQKWTAHVHTN